MNLLFVGKVDARTLRAALLMLGTDRTAGFPPVAPFDCAWKGAADGDGAASRQGCGRQPR